MAEKEATKPMAKDVQPLSQCSVTTSCSVSCKAGYVAFCTSNQGCWCYKPKCFQGGDVFRVSNFSAPSPP